jgi:GNAT superfamily N-acetyltransferase
VEWNKKLSVWRGDPAAESVVQEKNQVRKMGKKDRAAAKASRSRKKKAREEAREEELRIKGLIDAGMFTETGEAVSTMHKAQTVSPSNHSSSLLPQRDVLADFAPFSKFSRNGLDAAIEFTIPEKMDKEMRTWVLDLTRENMKEQYLAAEWGWADAEKRRELMDDAARYLVARSPEGEALGFVHFRFMLERSSPMIYVYELQLVDSVRRKGLGKRLMQILELIAAKWKMQW